MYSAAVPLIPGFADRWDLSTQATGVLAAAYPGGALLGSLAGGRLVGRAGARAATAAGFAAMVAGTVGFALAGSMAPLCIARLVQGLGSGLVWAGVLTWLIAIAGPDRRGQTIGGAVGAAVVGTLIGPILATVSAGLGRATTFVGVAAVMVVVAATTLLVQRAVRGPAAASGGVPIREAGLTPIVAVNLLPGLFMGAMLLLVPLRLAALGASETAVSGIFLLASGASAAISPAIGRRCDRDGTERLLRIGVVALSLGVLTLAAPTSPLLLGALTVVVSGVAFALFIVPALTALNERAARAGVGAGIAAALVNLTINAGELVGAPVAAQLSGATSDLVAYGVLAVLGLCAAAAPSAWVSSR